MNDYLTTTTYDCGKFCCNCDDLIFHLARALNDGLVLPDELGIALEAVIAAGVLAASGTPPRRYDWKRHAERDGFRRVLCDLVEQMTDAGIKRNSDSFAMMLLAHGRIYEKLCGLIDTMEMERHDEVLSLRNIVTLERLKEFRDAAIFLRLSEAA